MKKISLVFFLFLSGCAIDAQLSVRSDLRLVEGKSVYYEIKDSSVIAARVNRIIRKKLQEAGWKIGSNANTTNYSYSILTDIRRYSQTQIAQSGFDYIYLTEQTNEFPVFVMQIQNNTTHENIYEARITLDQMRKYDELEKFADIAMSYLFLNEDKKWNIVCTYKYERDKEIEKCSLEDMNAPVKPLFNFH